LKRLRLRILVLTLMAGLLVPVTAFARVLSICNMGGAKAKACCCHKGAKKAGCKTPAIDRQSCCKTLVTHSEKASATQGAGAGFDVPPAALLERLPAIAHTERALSEGARFAPRARAPPPIGPPLFLRDCRILS